MKKVLIPVTVLGLLLLPAIAAAQGDPFKERMPLPKMDAVQVDPEVQAWIDLLAAHMADRHDVIRQSAQRTLVTVGRAALPTLKKLSEGDDAAAADIARKLATRIKAGERRGRAMRAWGPRGGDGVGRPGPGGPPPEGRGVPGGRRMGPGKGHPGGPGLRGRRGMGRDRPGGPGLRGRGRPAARRFIALARIMKGLELSEDQKGQVKEILKAHREKTTGLLRKGGEDARPGLQDCKKELLKELKGILTDGQYKKLEESLERAGRHRGPPGGGPQGPGGPPPGHRPPGPGGGF